MICLSGAPLIKRSSLLAFVAAKVFGLSAHQLEKYKKNVLQCLIADIYGLWDGIFYTALSASPRFFLAINAI